MINITIDFGGDTITLYPRLNTNECTIEGTGTLTADYVITTSGTLYVGDKITFFYKGTVDKDVYDFTILGTNLSETQLNRQSTIEAVYNGSTWDLNITPNARAANWINPTDLMSTGDLDVLSMEVSFETGEQCVKYMYLPFNCTILNARFSCSKALANTDAGSVNISDVLNVTTVATLTIPLSTTLNTQVVNSAVNYLWENADQNTLISIETIKTTAGGKGLVSMVLQRT